jgi:AbrB family looped-hinge helix DNA binding protein
MEVEMTKITSKGQITVPVAIRKRLNLKTGDKVMFVADDGGIRMINASTLAFENGRTSLRDEAERSDND